MMAWIFGLLIGLLLGASFMFLLERTRRMKEVSDVTTGGIPRSCGSQG